MQTDRDGGEDTKQAKKVEIFTGMMWFEKERISDKR